LHRSPLARGDESLSDIRSSCDFVPHALGQFVAAIGCLAAIPGRGLKRANGSAPVGIAPLRCSLGCLSGVQRVRARPLLRAGHHETMIGSRNRVCTLSNAFDPMES
jgi:hypothetical protein